VAHGGIFCDCSQDGFWYCWDLSYILRPKSRLVWFHTVLATRLPANLPPTSQSIMKNRTVCHQVIIQLDSGQHTRTGLINIAIASITRDTVRSVYLYKPYLPGLHGFNEAISNKCLTDNFWFRTITACTNIFTHQMSLVCVVLPNNNNRERERECDAGNATGKSHRTSEKRNTSASWQR